MTHLYSASVNAFYDVDFEGEYKAAGSWPADLMEVDQATFMTFGCGNPPEGKVRGSDAGGLPAWVDPAPPTAQQVWEALKADASAALIDSDQVVLRCYEDAVQVPADWIAYRKALRLIVGSSALDASLSMPSKPAYPPGT
jgi:hypothetical protein